MQLIRVHRSIVAAPSVQGAATAIHASHPIQAVNEVPGGEDESYSEDTCKERRVS
jgi:hypothetical protein